ncbi:hypothetical protein BKA64DRAFT_771266 [Cadophora sp. MPI-SDFR-AT-0126]|nr:hypothetical protein BKA64DRAFT_771266 [Leotiomycetes sp. MPI-SDFR-AT-0126]
MCPARLNTSVKPLLKPQIMEDQLYSPNQPGLQRRTEHSPKAIEINGGSSMRSHHMQPTGGSKYQPDTGVTFLGNTSDYLISTEESRQKMWVSCEDVDVDYGKSASTSSSNIPQNEYYDTQHRPTSPSYQSLLFDRPIPITCEHNDGHTDSIEVISPSAFMFQLACQNYADANNTQYYREQKHGERYREDNPKHFGNLSPTRTVSFDSVAAQELIFSLNKQIYNFGGETPRLGTSQSEAFPSDGLAVATMYGTKVDQKGLAYHKGVNSANIDFGVYPGITPLAPLTIRAHRSEVTYPTVLPSSSRMRPGAYDEAEQQNRGSAIELDQRPASHTPEASKQNAKRRKVELLLRCRSPRVYIILVPSQMLEYFSYAIRVFEIVYHYGSRLHGSARWLSSKAGEGSSFPTTRAAKSLGLSFKGVDDA